MELWFIQVILAIVSLTEALLLAYLGYKVEFYPLYRSIKNLFRTTLKPLGCYLSVLPTPRDASDFFSPGQYLKIHQSSVRISGTLGS